MALVAVALGAPEAGRKGNDRALAIALLAGAPGAARRAWDRFAPIVLRILRRTFGADSDRQDLLQEVFIRVFRRIHDLKDRDALRAFVVHICLGVAQNELRSRWVRRRFGLTRTGELPEHPIAPADFEARQAIDRYRRLLDGLRGDDRALFVLRYVEKMELTEVAAALAWSLTKAKRRLRRVAARVTALMQGEPALAEYATATNRTTNSNNDKGDDR